MNDSIGRFVDWMGNIASRVFPWISSTAEAWGRKLREFWERPNVGGKALAIVWAIGGVLIASYAVYFLLFLIPILIMAAFVAAILASMRGRRF